MLSVLPMTHHPLFMQAGNMGSPPTVNGGVGGCTRGDREA